MMRIGVEDDIGKQGEICDETNQHGIRNVGEFAVAELPMFPTAYEPDGCKDWTKIVADMERRVAHLFVFARVARFKLVEKQPGEHEKYDNNEGRDYE
jgi:hypothetical protein